MEIFLALFGVVTSFFVGSFTTKISINNGNDKDRCNAIIASIDSIVASFHNRFDNSANMQLLSGGLFDYEIKSLVDDTTLLPIIGKPAFEAEYTDTIAEMYKLTLDSPQGMPQADQDSLLASMNTNAINLKKIINSNRRDWRLFSRN